jgi:Calcineurin-like phosphoesterase
MRSAKALRTARAFILLIAGLWAARLIAQQPDVKPIDAPTRPLPAESASASTTRFSFLVYGDARSGNEPGVPGDGQVLNAEHSRLMDVVLSKVDTLASTPFPLRFVLHTGDAVLRGANAVMWNVSFTPILDRLTRRGGLPFFFAAGNHDVTGMPLGDPGRAPGLRNMLTVMSNLMPPDGSPRRLSGYPTYSFGYGNLFAITFDSNIAGDPTQLKWVSDQLEHLDRTRYRHVVVFFHHPVFSSGPHGGTAHLEPQTIAIRELYMPLFRRHHVRLLMAGHDHLFDHWLERYTDKDGARHRLDQIVTGGGGAPIYVYSGEPDLRGYKLGFALEHLGVEHVARPGATIADNPHHFIVVQVDGDRLSVEVVGSGAPYAPYNGRSRADLFDRES